MSPILWMIMLVMGILIKITDDVFDEGLLRRRTGWTMGLSAIPMMTVLMLDPEGFILVGAIFWTTVLRGKIDNIGFYFGFSATAISWALIYSLTFPFSIDMVMMVGFGLGVLGIVITSVLHDRVKAKDNLLWQYLIEERYLMCVLDIPIMLLGIVGPMAIIGIFIMNTGYYLGNRISNRISDRTPEVILLEKNPKMILSANTD